MNFFSVILLPSSAKEDTAKIKHKQILMIIEGNLLLYILEIIGQSVRSEMTHVRDIEGNQLYIKHLNLTQKRGTKFTMQEKYARIFLFLNTLTLYIYIYMYEMISS